MDRDIKLGSQETCQNVSLGKNEKKEAQTSKKTFQ
jgi:hypothetical protein